MICPATTASLARLWLVDSNLIYLIYAMKVVVKADQVLLLQSLIPSLIIVIIYGLKKSYCYIN